MQLILRRLPISVLHLHSLGTTLGLEDGRLPLRDYSVDGYSYDDGLQPNLVEVWSEKSGDDATLRPIALGAETSPKTAQRPRGARDGRTALHGEKPETVELAANLRPWHPSRPTFGSLEGEAWQGGRGGA